MKSEIVKCELLMTGFQPVELPKGAEILSVANQNGSLCMWAKVDASDAKEEETRHIEIIGTGHLAVSETIPQDMDRMFLGTVVINPFVWHVFELV